MWTKLTVIVTAAGAAKSVTRAGHTLTILEKRAGRWLLAATEQVQPQPRTECAVVRDEQRHV